MRENFLKIISNFKSKLKFTKKKKKKPKLYSRTIQVNWDASLHLM